MIRAARHEDTPAIIAMGAKFHAQSGAPMAFDQRAAAALISGLIESNGGAVFISDSGMIGGAISPAYCDPAWLMAVELFWWAERDGLALLKAFEEWAAESGAKEVRMTTLAALPRAASIMRRRGYVASEISHSKVI